MNALPLFDGKELRDEGIKRSELTAGQKWLDEADKFMDVFLATLKSGDTFMTEDARVFINDLGCIEPAHPRVWGSVILRAVRSGRIIKSGIKSVKNPAAHMANANVWKKVMSWYPRNIVIQEVMQCPCCDGVGIRIDKNTGKERICVGCMGSGELKVKKKSF